LRGFICIVALFALSACRVDVTQTIDTSAKGREVITYRETFDDEAFDATTQLGGASAFGFDAAKEDGWDVRGSSGLNEHTFVYQRSFSGQDVEGGINRLAYNIATDVGDDAFPLGPTAFIGLPITASVQNEKVTSIPPLLRVSDILKEHGRKDRDFQIANARVNAAAVDSVVHIHIEVRDSTGVHRIDPSFATATMLSPSTAVSIHLGPVWPISPLLAFWRSVGSYGVFDFEHASPPLCSTNTKYHKSRMFSIGVYAAGARIPEHLMDSAETLAADWLAKHPVKCP
jgi:hypothetical protein